MTTPVTLSDYAGAALEIFRSNFWPLPDRMGKIESISEGAGQLLYQGGLVPSVQDGVVMFHQQLARSKPSLGRILRRGDELSGRIPKRKTSRAQRIVRTAVKGGLVRRDKSGRIKGLDPAVKSKIRAVQLAEKRKREARLKERAYQTKVRLGIRRPRRRDQR